jgi:hypothetical protein
MTTFNLTNTATEVNTALQAVVGADSTPDPASANMVTSQGIYTHVNTELGPFKGKTLTTESTGIAATDNDTSVPTCAAVNDALAGLGKTATYGVASGGYGTSGSSSNQTEVLPITETSDTHSLGTVTNGVVTLGAGTYLVSYFGQYKEDDDDTSDYWDVQLRHNGSAKLTARVNETDREGDSTYVTVSGTTAVSSNSPQTVDICAKEVRQAAFHYINVNLTIVKLA